MNANYVLNHYNKLKRGYWNCIASKQGTPSCINLIIKAFKYVKCIMKKSQDNCWLEIYVEDLVNMIENWYASCLDDLLPQPTHMDLLGKFDWEEK